jgi:hypothetical protein
MQAVLAAIYVEKDRSGAANGSAARLREKLLALTEGERRVLRDGLLEFDAA